MNIDTGKIDETVLALLFWLRLMQPPPDAL